MRPDISVICDKYKLTERRCEGRVKHYSFRDRVPAGIYEDFTIDFSEIDDHLQG